MATRADLAGDLRFLLSDKEVPESLQDRLAATGVRSMERFALIDDNRAAIRTMLKDEWGLTAESNPNVRAHSAAFIAAWETAVARTDKIREEAAQAAASRLPRVMPAKELSGIRKAFNLKYFALADEDSPSDRYLELREDMIAQQEQKAESLELSTNREEDDELGVGEESRVGVVRVRKPPKKVALPSTPEELRRRLKVWGFSWLLTATRYDGQPAFAGIEPQTIYDYIEHLLGKDVFRLTAKGADGKELAHPPLSLVVSYDFHVRRKLAELMNEGRPFTDALKEAREDRTVRERYFLTPLMLDRAERAPRRGRSRSRVHSQDQSRTRPQRDAPPPPSKGKGKSRDLPEGWRAVNTKGQQICISHNMGRCSVGGKPKCRFVHVCAKCLKPNHIAVNCKPQGRDGGIDGAERATVPPVSG